MKLKDLKPGERFLSPDISEGASDRPLIFQKLDALDGSPPPNEGHCYAASDGFLWTIPEDTEVVICGI